MTSTHPASASTPSASLSPSASAKFYRQFILEASRSPVHRGKIEKSSLKSSEQVVEFAGSNPSCGDQLTLYLKIEYGGVRSQEGRNITEFEPSAKILDARFEGSGCAISMASAHFLCENLIGKTVKTAKKYISNYLKSLDSSEPNQSYTPLDNIAQMPARVKCARLAWGAIGDKLHSDK